MKLLCSLRNYANSKHATDSLREIWIIVATGQPKWDSANGNGLLQVVYYTRKVHLNAVSLYDYGTIVVTPRRVNIHISTSVRTLLCTVHCTQFDSIYLFLNVLYKISSNYAAFMHYFLGSCITFFAKTTHPKRATDLIYHGDRPDSREIAFSRIPAWHNVPLSPLKLAFITCRSH